MSVRDEIVDRGHDLVPILERLIAERGDDLFWHVVDALKARRARKRRRARDAAVRDVQETAQERKRRGDGQL